MGEHKILVAYTTNAGSTAEAARMVGEELREHGVDVDILRLEHVTSLEPYSAVVVGGPMIMGWHRAAVRFIKKNQAALSRMPVAYFITASSLTALGETQVGNTPVAVDPYLAKAPARPGQLSFKERYATVTNYLQPVLRAAPAVHPLSVAFFGGRLDLYRLKWWQTLFVLLVIQARPGGSHNEAFIRKWAAGLPL